MADTNTIIVHDADRLGLSGFGFEEEWAGAKEVPVCIQETSFYRRSVKETQGNQRVYGTGFRNKDCYERS